MYIHRQNDIYYDSEQVYSSPEKEDNLALFFFKDGLRELTFKKGLMQDEMEDFLGIIAVDFDREVVDDDIVTLFWERDFQNIQYVVDEAFLADEDDYEERAVAELEENAAVSDDELHKAFDDAFKEDEEEIKDVSIIPLSDKDLQMLMKELEKDSLDKTGKLANILFEMLYMSESRNDCSDAVDSIISTVEFSLKHGDMQLVNQILADVKKMISDANIEKNMKDNIRKIILFAGSDVALNFIGEILDSGQEIEEKIIEDYTKFLEKNAIAPFMKILGELKSIHARKIVIDALIFLGPKDIIVLANGLNDSRWYVVRNIIFILRKIGDKRAVDYLLRTVKHGDIRVKKEVIRTLGELGGANVLIALRECLDEQDGHVRSSALKAIGSIPSEAAKRIIMDRITDKSFINKDFEEKKEYFEALSRWKDNATYDFLIKTMKKRVFWKRAKNYENKACAAYCLGLIGNKDALPILNKSINSGNKILKEFSHTAVKRLEHGQ